MEQTTQLKVMEFFFHDDPWKLQLVYGSASSIGHFVQGNRTRGIQTMSETAFGDHASMESYVEQWRVEHPQAHVVPLV